MPWRNFSLPRLCKIAANRKTSGKPTLRPIDTLMERLDGLQGKASHFMARCPAHDDQRPSLSITEKDDGTLLLHCFAGCGAGDVVAAIGLSLSDLYPDRPHEHHGQPIRTRDRWNARALLLTLRAEATLVQIAASDLANGKTLSPADTERLHVAAQRIARVCEIAT